MISDVNKEKDKEMKEEYELCNNESAIELLTPIHSENVRKKYEIGSIPETLHILSEKGSVAVSPYNDNASVSPAGSLSPMKCSGMMNKYYSNVIDHCSNIDEADMEEEESSEDSELIFEGRIAAISPVYNEKSWLLSKVDKEKAVHMHSHSIHRPCENGNNEAEVYRQSFVLGIAFACIWLPQNVMAPNLTEMAHYFGFSDATRDVLLGANIAFATSVLSFPMSLVIGVLADVTSRKYLYALVVSVCGMSSICTGCAQTYTQLYMCRFITGGCMAGATPVAFSLLGDYFSTKDRNAASSGLTAMMGMGIIVGQVFSGMAAPTYGWQFPFFISGVLCLISSLLVLLYVQEPVRGGTEKVLQDMLKKGMKYDKKLTARGLLNALFFNPSNCLLIIQGFFSSVPWGIIFVFLNDYLSQEQGLSVQDATLLVLVFGIGCAVGGLLGGWIGQKTTQMRREYMPMFMALSTVLGILPFYALLNDKTFHTATTKAIFYAFSGGCIASLPSVNVRPAIINVNPPEIRGATLTAATLIINIARGIGPSFLTTVCVVFNVSRSFSFNILLIIFWLIAALQLLLLAFYLPHDQDKMEQELATYAAAQETTLTYHSNSILHSNLCSIDNLSLNNDEEDTVISIAERTISFDAEAARETLHFFNQTLHEIIRNPSYDTTTRSSLGITLSHHIPLKHHFFRIRSSDSNTKYDDAVNFDATVTAHGNDTIICSDYADSSTDIDVIHNTTNLV